MQLHGRIYWEQLWAVQSVCGWDVQDECWVRCLHFVWCGHLLDRPRSYKRDNLPELPRSLVLSAAAVVRCSGLTVRMLVPAFTVSASGSNEQTDCVCDLGYEGPDGGACAECARDTYKDVTGSSACTSCPFASGSLRQSTELSDCICNAGYSLESVDCVACAAGKYKPNNGSQACTTSSPGFYVDVQVASRRSACASAMQHSGLTFGRLPLPGGHRGDCLSDKLQQRRRFRHLSPHVRCAIPSSDMADRASRANIGRGVPVQCRVFWT